MFASIDIYSKPYVITGKHLFILDSLSFNSVYAT